MNKHSRGAFRLFDYIYDHILWSKDAFGPGQKTEGLIKHIRKELDEVTAKPNDVEEWVDIMILAIDGAWRAGHSPKAICEALATKQYKNVFSRKWPDWRTAKPGEPIEHIREECKHHMEVVHSTYFKCLDCGKVQE